MEKKVGPLDLYKIMKMDLYERVLEKQPRSRTFVKLLEMYRPHPDLGELSGSAMLGHGGHLLVLCERVIWSLHLEANWVLKCGRVIRADLQDRADLYLRVTSSFLPGR